MLKCSKCGCELPEKAALVYGKEKNIICQSCFKEATGMDYKDFAMHQAIFKRTLVSMLICIAATAYAFIEKGAMYGGIAVLMTILVYFYSTRVKK